MKQKLISLAVGLMMALTASAQFSGSGSGTQSNPYLIFNPIQLDQVRNFLGSSVYFKLMADIDLQEYIADNYPTQGWLPIGNSSSDFKGYFDGNGHKITGLTINRPTTNYVGLFGSVAGVTIKGLSVEADIIGYDYCGGIVGLMDYGTISNCNISGSVRGDQYVGGITGLVARNASTINNCSTKVTVSGQTYTGGVCGSAKGTSISKCCVVADITTSGSYSGGVAGYFEANCGSSSISSTSTNKISSCYVSGNISASGINVGGVVGQVQGNSYSTGYPTTMYYYDVASIDNNYFYGKVVGNKNVGGICGYSVVHGSKYAAYALITKNYSNASIFAEKNAGGILGMASVGYVSNNVAINSSVSAIDSVGRIIANYTSDVTIGTVGTANANKALNTTKIYEDGVEIVCEDGEQHGQGVGKSVLKYKATYQGIGWDFSTIWDQQETESYPYFKWQVAPPTLNSLVAGSTVVTGNGTNGATISVEINGASYQTVCSGNSWSVTTPALVAGATVYATASIDSLFDSYRVSTIVSYLGQGTETDPYQIYSAQELANMSGSGYYKLMNDIDISSLVSLKIC